MATIQGHENSWHPKNNNNNLLFVLIAPRSKGINGQLCAINVMERNWQLLLLLLYDDDYVVKLPNILTHTKKLFIRIMMMNGLEEWEMTFLDITHKKKEFSSSS